MDEILATSNTLIVAGSETTATVLSATLYYVTSHPQVLNKLSEEIRSTFSSEQEITILSVQDLHYTLAVLDESMRMYPAVPTGPPRLIAKGGDVILGQFVPEDVSDLFLSPLDVLAEIGPLNYPNREADGRLCVAVASVP